MLRRSLATPRGNSDSAAPAKALASVSRSTPAYRSQREAQLENRSGDQQTSVAEQRASGLTQRSSRLAALADHRSRNTSSAWRLAVLHRAQCVLRRPRESDSANPATARRSARLLVNPWRG